MSSTNNNLWSTPNKLSLVRVAAIPLLIFFCYWGGKLAAILATCTFVLASLTDILDGYWARTFNQESRIGKILDPLADKLLVISALIMLVRADLVAAWIVILIIGREIVVNTIRGIAATENIIIPAGSHGKSKTALQDCALVGLLLGPENNFWQISWYTIGYLLIIISLFFSLSSAFDYVQQYRRARRQKKEVP